MYDRMLPQRLGYIASCEYSAASLNPKSQLQEEAVAEVEYRYLTTHVNFSSGTFIPALGVALSAKKLQSAVRELCGSMPIGLP